MRNFTFGGASLNSRFMELSEAQAQRRGYVERPRHRKPRYDFGSDDLRQAQARSRIEDIQIEREAEQATHEVWD